MLPRRPVDPQRTENADCLVRHAIDYIKFIDNAVSDSSRHQVIAKQPRRFPALVLCAFWSRILWMIFLELYDGVSERFPACFGCDQRRCQFMGIVVSNLHVQ